MTYIPHDVVREDRPDGSIFAVPRPARLVARNTGAWLHAGPGRPPIAYSLRSARAKAGARCATPRRCTSAPIARRCSPRGSDQKRPIGIMSGNSVDHALLALAAQYVGVPIVPLAEQYSLVPDAHPRLQYAVETVRPT